MDPEAKLRELGLTLPAPPKPFAAYRTAVRSGDLLFVSGMGPVRDGKVAMQGQVGKEFTVQQARRQPSSRCWSPSRRSRSTSAASRGCGAW